MFNET